MNQIHQDQPPRHLLPIAVDDLRRLDALASLFQVDRDPRVADSLARAVRSFVTRTGGDAASDGGMTVGYAVGAHVCVLCNSEITEGQILVWEPVRRECSHFACIGKRKACG